MRPPCLASQADMHHKWVRDLAGVSLTGFLSVRWSPNPEASTCALGAMHTLTLRAPFHLGAVRSRTVPSVLLQVSAGIGHSQPCLPDTALCDHLLDLGFPASRPLHLAHGLLRWIASG